MSKSIESARIQQFRQIIYGNQQGEKETESNQNNDHNKIKTLTERAIDNQMKMQDESELDESFELSIEKQKELKRVTQENKI